MQATSLVCLTFIPTASNSQPAPNVTLSVISGVSGCATNVNNVTLGCLGRSILLTITGTGFPKRGTAVTVGDEICRLTTPQMQSPTQVVCYLPTLWNGVETGELLAVVMMDLWNAVQSAPYYGAQLVPISVPRIDSIAGCQGSGRQTSNCQLQQGQADVITLTWDNLAESGDLWQVWWGPYLKLPISPSSPTPTSLVIPLNASATQLSGLGRLAATDLFNTLIYVVVKKSGLVSNVVAISLAPIYLTISGVQGCSSVSAFQVSDCVPGTSVVYLEATNIYPPLSVTVTDQPCIDVLRCPGTCNACWPPLRTSCPACCTTCWRRRGSTLHSAAGRRLHHSAGDPVHHLSSVRARLPQPHSCPARLRGLRCDHHDRRFLCTSRDARCAGHLSLGPPTRRTSTLQCCPNGR